jgi:poly(3-hydroxybutyrate) depolymerase
MLAVLAALAVPAAAPAAGQTADARLAAGSGHFLFPFSSAGEMRWIVVWYHRPADILPNAPVVFVMHGATRTGKNYRKQWMPHAVKRGFILPVPEFSRGQFPGTAAYNLGSMIGKDGTQPGRNRSAGAAVMRRLFLFSLRSLRPLRLITIFRRPTLAPPAR